MREYPKIDSVFKRDMSHPKKQLILGSYSNDVFAYLTNNEWIFTEKVDGTNIRVMCVNDAVTFGGRTDNASLPAPLVKRLEERFHTQREKIAELFPESACLYGEGYGAKIQKGGGNYRSDQDFVLFDVKVGDWWLQRDAVESIAYSLGLNVVPIVGQGTLHQAVEFVKNGFNSVWGGFLAEGIVARPSVELKMRSGQRIITKLKHCDF